MLRLFAKGLEGEEELFFWESLSLSEDEDLPADELRVKLWGAYPADYSEISLYDDKKLLFTGPVDEQRVELSDSERTEIVARSFVSLLLDNEAYPKTYIKPDTELIFRRYLEPLGVEKYIGENRLYPGEFKVNKGMSCFEVLKKFASIVYECIPHFEGKTLVLQRDENAEPLCFSLTNGIPYTKLSYTRNRHKLISKVRAKVKDGGEYSVIIDDLDAQSRGIRRERFLNAAAKSGLGLKTADRYLKAARREFEEIRLCADRRITHAVGRSVVIRSDRGNTYEGFYVSSLRYALSENKEETVLTLRRSEKK